MRGCVLCFVCYFGKGGRRGLARGETGRRRCRDVWVDVGLFFFGGGRVCVFSVLCGCFVGKVVGVLVLCSQDTHTPFLKYNKTEPCGCRS